MRHPGGESALVHVALLRGINVGTARRIAMSDLQRIAHELGFRQPRTVLNSGNLIYQTEELSTVEAADRLKAAIEAGLGLSVPVMVLTTIDLAAALRESPWTLHLDTDLNPSQLLMAWPDQPESLRLLSSLAGRDWSPEQLVVGTMAAYLHCPQGVLGGQLFKQVQRACKDQITTRNVATVRKILGVVG